VKDNLRGKFLTNLVVHCFTTLDTFGKPPEAMESMIEMFQMVLARFSKEQIESAFRIYVETQTVMPKPADIVRIIEPPLEPRKWCGITFLDIKKRGCENQFITDDEKQYCDDFITAKATASPDERLLIDDAIKKADRENSQYWID